MMMGLTNWLLVTLCFFQVVGFGLSIFFGGRQRRIRTVAMVFDVASLAASRKGREWLATANDSTMSDTVRGNAAGRASYYAGIANALVVAAEQITDGTPAAHVMDSDQLLAKLDRHLCIQEAPHSNAVVDK
jgi:hypothetical protein